MYKCTHTILLKHGACCHELLWCPSARTQSFQTKLFPNRISFSVLHKVLSDPQSSSRLLLPVCISRLAFCFLLFKLAFCRHTLGKYCMLQIIHVGRRQCVSCSHRASVPSCVWSCYREMTGVISGLLHRRILALGSETEAPKFSPEASGSTKGEKGKHSSSDSFANVFCHVYKAPGIWKLGYLPYRLITNQQCFNFRDTVMVWFHRVTHPFPTVHLPVNLLCTLISCRGLLSFAVLYTSLCLSQSLDRMC